MNYNKLLLIIFLLISGCTTYNIDKVEKNFVNKKHCSISNIVGIKRRGANRVPKLNKNRKLVNLTKVPTLTKVTPIWKETLHNQGGTRLWWPTG